MDNIFYVFERDVSMNNIFYTLIVFLFKRDVFANNIFYAFDRDGFSINHNKCNNIISLKH